MFETLADLAVNRHLPAEAEEKLAPFRSKEFSLSLEFVSASRTFGNRFDPVYEQGDAVICKPAGETLEISVLFPPDENDRVEDLSPGDPFEAKVTLLDFDTLYQRAVLGQVLEESPEGEPTEEVSPEVEDSGEEEVPEETTGEPEQQAPAEEPLPQEDPTAAAPEAPAEIPQATPEPAPPKPKEPAKFTISSAPPRPRPEDRPRRSTKHKQSKLFQLKETISNKIKRLKPKPCPNGHGPLTRYHKGKMYCKVCGWPSHRDHAKHLESSSPSDEEGPSCRRIAFILIIAFIIMKSCVSMMQR